MSEKRFLTTHSPVKLQRSGGKQFLTGYAAKYFNPADEGTQYQIDGDTVERILPGAFAATLADSSADVVGLFNHDPSLLLARRSSGTLTLSTDSVGLKYRMLLPDTQAGRDVRTLAERGDLRGSSFAFVVRSGGQRWTREAGWSVRELIDVALMDCSVVTNPAYPSATAGLSDRAVVPYIPAANASKSERLLCYRQRADYVSRQCRGWTPPRTVTTSRPMDAMDQDVAVARARVMVQQLRARLQKQ